jgi:TorA maturation chaperone TorD
METDSHENNILKAYTMLLYFAGSMIMYEPSEECISDFWENGMIKNLPIKSSNPTFIMAASQLRESCKNTETCWILLRDDYRRLFASKGLAPVYESVYSGKNNTTGDNKYQDISDIYKSYGWNHQFRNITEEDHLGVELLFLTWLIEKYTYLDDDTSRKEMRGDIVRFIDYHLLSWLPYWNRKMQDGSETLCYKGIGTLILAVSEDLRSVFSHGSNEEFSSSGNLKN